MDNSEFKLIQITDTHILDDGAESFDGYDTSASLTRVITHIKQHEENVQMVILTGDSVHEPTVSAYEKLAGYLSEFSKPVYYLPGNHDDPVVMDKVLSAHGYQSDKQVMMSDWQVILLDTRIKNEHKGALSAEQLAFLQGALSEQPKKHALIALHHHPVSISSRWMDAMSLENSDAFLSIIESQSQVKGIIWGHIHQQFEMERNGIKLMGTPSTCLQFTPGSEEFSVDDKPPGYRRLTLTATGLIHSEVIYLEQ